MAEARLDLSGLGTLDLEALRLGAQVMAHKAMLAAHPRVERYFSQLQLRMDTELSQRRGVHDGRPLVPPSALPLGAPDTGTAASGVEGETPANHRISLVEDRRVAAEYLDLLGANDRLSAAVRQTVRILRERLDATVPGDA